ncbi:MAG: hypothetical protein AAFY36_17985, partial [Bacteroidota bacterium]
MSFKTIRNYLSLLLLCCAFGAQAQQAASLPIRNVPVVSFPAQDNAALLANELAQRVPGRAPH